MNGGDKDQIPKNLVKRVYKYYKPLNIPSGLSCWVNGHVMNNNNDKIYVE